MHRDKQVLRLAFVSHKFQPNDGQGRVNYEVVKAALAAGHHVTMVAMDCAEDLAKHPNARFIPTGKSTLPTELLRNLVFASQSATWLRAHLIDFDLIQANGFVTWETSDVVAAHFVHSGWAKSKYYPFRSLKPYDIYQRLYTALNSRWEKQAFTRARQVVAVSKTLIPDLVELGVKPERVTVILNGVDTEQFQPGRAGRENFNLPSAGPLALFVGDIRTPRKNLDTVLRALKSVPTLHLAVAGSVAGSPYPGMARELGVADRVHFLGKTSQVPLLMRSVNFFVLPSRYEAHPLVLLEAMASGLPSLVSGTFGADEFIGGSGILLKDPDDSAELASSMAELIADPGRCSEMGHAGRKQAESMSWNIMAASYLSLYAKLLRIEDDRSS